MRAPIVLVGKHSEQFFVVARIRPRLAGESRRVHAGLSIERAHANTRIVRKRRELGAAARVARLGERVLDEGAVRFFCIGDAQAGLRNDLRSERREQRFELTELPGIGGGEHEFFHAYILTREASNPTTPPAARAPLLKRGGESNVAAIDYPAQIRRGRAPPSAWR